MAEEKRRFTRVDVQYPVTLQIPGGKLVEGRVVNLSMKGILVELPEELCIDGAVAFSIPLSGDASGILIAGEADVVRTESDGSFGLHLLRTDVESLTHLRRLVELNMGDGDKAREEMTHW